MSYLNKHNPQIPTQRQPLDERQVKNAAGGYVYPIIEWEALTRFLILGTAGGSHYETESDLTKQNLNNTIFASNRILRLRENGLPSLEFSLMKHPNAHGLIVSTDTRQ